MEVFSDFDTSVSEESTTEARHRMVTARKSGEMVEDLSNVAIPGRHCDVLLHDYLS